MILRDVDHLLPPCASISGWSYKHDHEIYSTASSLGRGGEIIEEGGGHVENSVCGDMGKPYI